MVWRDESDRAADLAAKKIRLLDEEAKRLFKELCELQGRSEKAASERGFWLGFSLAWLLANLALLWRG